MSLFSKKKEKTACSCGCGCECNEAKTENTETNSCCGEQISGSREKKGRLILHNIEKEEQDNILLFFLLYI